MEGNSATEPIDVGGESQHDALAWPLTWLLAILPFIGFWAYGLFDLDEGFYGAVVSEMNRRGEWITPYYNGHPWFEKPILLYWFAKPCLMVLGNMIGPRVPSVLATLALFGTAANFAHRRMSDAAAQRTVLILAGSLLVVGAGRMMLVDPLMNLCFAAAMLCFWDSLEGDLRARWWAGGLLGLAILAKGPLALILFILIAAVLFWREPALRPKFKGGWIGFALLLCAAVSTWYVPAYLRDGQTFVQKFLVEQNLQRFTGGDSAHSIGLAGLPFYLPVLILGMLPWSVYLIQAWPRAKDSTPLQRYLAIWALVALVFFTVSGTKLVHYILPACLPIALLVGEWFARRDGDTRVVMPTLLPGMVTAVFAVWGISQFGAVWWYGQDTAEVHRVALAAKALGQPVASYQMPRREHGLGTLKPKVQETSHPSLVMYLNKSVLESDKFEELLAAPKPLLVITRLGRMTDGDFREAALHNQRLKTVPVAGAMKNYVLYSLEEEVSARDRRH